MEFPSKWLKKGAWTAEEDSRLRQCIDKYGEGKWHRVPLRAGLNRCRKSCRLRWLNYLKPSIKRGRFNSDEIDLLLRLHKLLGNRWTLIAGRLPGRTGNDVKNYWNTHLCKNQEPCCETKMRKTDIITCSATKLDVIKPQPRSFNNNNDGNTNGEVGNKDDSIKSNKEEIVNNLEDEESMWWETLLEGSQVADLEGPAATTISYTFDVEQLWSMFDANTGELS